MAEDESSVRVAVRIRPQIAREVIEMCRVCTSVTPGEPQVTLGSDKSFTYDYVFDIEQDQHAVYEACAKPLVEGSLQGYNATILAYGQTGSGKTYTMGTGFDVEVQEEQVGIIPRAIHQLFAGIDQLTMAARVAGEPAPQFKVTAQFLELYNEEVFDLFDPVQDNFSLTKCKSGIRIHEDTNHSIYVTGVTSRTVQTAQEALHCLRHGALSRTTASTQMNSQSSRSHAIFTLLIRQQRLIKMDNEDEDATSDHMESSDGTTQEFVTLTAKFHFVDLAGSERLKRTGATGDRAKEGISINCGLLALGNVISALGDKSKKALHVPYRDSRLTRLLQDSLGGNSRTVMIACVSPSDRDFMETLNTLKYANRARNIQNRVTINQDKSSRTISLLRQEIQQLQLELLEYKQGKRVVGEDGVESVNDMFHENTMLQSELNNLRTRVKAMQDTIDALSAKNTQLLADKATHAWINSDAGEDGDMSGVIRDFLSEVETLRAKLLESESTVQQLRKNLSRSNQMRKMSLSPTPARFSDGEVDSLLEQAKRDLAKDLAKTKESRSEEGKENGNNSSDSDDAESGSDSESDASSTATDLREEVALLDSEIDLKQRLITELENSQRRLHNLRKHYEDKLLGLQAKIRETQEERDTVLASFRGQANQPTEKVAKVREQYEKKLNDMQKEVKSLQSAKREHAKLLRSQSQYEGQVRTLRNEVGDMKKTKVKLMNAMRVESVRHKEVESKRNKEIAQLRKETRRAETVIKSLEAKNRAKDVVLRRKHEEVSALRRSARDGMSHKAAGRLRPKVISASPKQAKTKWTNLEKKITANVHSKMLIVTLEREMERLMNERKVRHAELQTKLHRLSEVQVRQPRDRSAHRDLEEEVEALRANLEYIEESITDSQHNIIQIEENKMVMENSDLVASLKDLSEASYLIEKLCNMALNQSCLVAQREVQLKEVEAKTKQLERQCVTQEQLLQHMVQENTLVASTISTNSNSLPPNSSNSSSASSRSTSPTDNLNGNSEERPLCGKYRRRTALPEELLYVTNTPTPPVQLSPEHMPPPPRALSRVPSVPATLKGLKTDQQPPLSSPVLSRRTYTRQESTSPRVNRRTYVLTTNTLTGKPGSMEQGLDVSPPGSPPSYRRFNSRDDNVFSRLTSSTTQLADQQNAGVISVYQGKVPLKAPLLCSHVAEGHSRAVLAVCATDDLLFSASRDRTVKVWDLAEGVEAQTLGNHPNNVVAVKYSQESRLLYTVSSAYVRVWDLRTTKCIRTLCSSGTTTNGVLNSSAQIPAGESQMNDIALNHSGQILYTAASDRVRVWDIRRFAVTGKLSGGHQAAVMCLAVGKLSQKEDIVITGSKDHYIKVFEVAGEAGGVFSPRVNLEPPHYDGIQSLAIRGEVLFSGSRDSIIKKWDLNRQELITSVSNAHKDWVCGLAFVPNQPLLISVCRGGVLKMWSADTCVQLGEMRAHESPINAITTNSTHVFTASNDNTVRLWRRNSKMDFILSEIA